MSDNEIPSPHAASPGAAARAPLGSGVDRFEFKIGVIGPSRVGKTSLVTALLEDTQRLLAGTPVSMEPVGSTKARVTQQKNELRASLIAGEFDPGRLAGTQEPFVFELELRAERYALHLAALDYPGKWLAAGERTPQEEARWKAECEPWLRESQSLLVPIDAAVAMESTLKRELVAAQELLQIAEAEEVTRRWAKARKELAEPGLLLLAPLKCEAYFADNGGLRDRSDELHRRVLELYGYLVEAARQEAGELVTVEYHPIDTFGCVELKRAEWTPDPSGAIFTAEYMVRPPGRVSPKGADGLLVALCRHTVRGHAERDRGFALNFWKWLTGERRRLRDVVEKLSKQATGPRVRLL